jgi:outer membrane protein assembly factor BamB
MKYRAILSARARFVSPGAVCAALLLLAHSAPAAQIRGRVFVDRNDDGAAGTGEPGLAHVAVSDGRSIVLTSSDGSYSIETEDAPYVFVSLPRGYRAAGLFYAEADATGPVDFALVEWPESSRDTARFVQVSDTHVTREPDSVRTFREDLAEIDAVEPKPAFVLATGDLVQIGSESAQFEGYVAGSENLVLPLFNLPGNHDLYEPGGLAHYHRYLGPDYYSFNFGGCHFVLVNGNDTSDGDEQAPIAQYIATGELPPETPEAVGVQHRWILRDLAAAPEGTTVIFATHFLPSPLMLRYFSKLGARAVLSGHWHGHRVSESHGVLDVNSPPLRFGGIDRHPRSFRVIEITDGKLTNELRLGGFRRHATIVAPAGMQRAGGGTVPLLVNAYDSRTDIESVVCRIGGEEFALRQTGKWSWAGEARLPEGLRGTQPVTATIRAANGEIWKSQGTFEIAASAPQLRLKWSASTGGFVGISSPRIGGKAVVIGVDDSGLESCGVAAFDFEGRKLWFFRTDSGIKNNVAVADGTVFAASVAGWLYAIDEASGALRWKTELPSEKVRWENAATNVADGVVHVGSSGVVAAVDAATGTILWKTRVAERDDWWPTSYTVPVVAHDRVFLSNLRYGAFALDARSGALEWNLEGKFAGLVVDDHVIHTVRDGLPTALDLHTGATLWNGTESIGASASRPVHARDRIVIGSADGTVRAFATKDGALLWSYQTGPSLTSLEPYKRDGSDVNSSPVVAGGLVYVGASDGVLHVISLDDGRGMATYAVGAPIGSSPVIAGDMLYIGAYDGNIHAFSLHE